MNILHLQLTGNPGGIVSLCRDIANHSNNRNIMYFLMSGGTVADAIKGEGHQIEIDNLSNSNILACAKRLEEYCRNNDIDVIINHSNGPKAILIVSYVKKRNKNIKWVMYFHSAPEDMNIKTRIIYKPFIKYQNNQSNARVAISEFVKQSACRVFNVEEDKIVVVYNGVDTTKFIEKDKNRTGQLTFIYVGRLFEKKGVHLLVDAVNQIRHYEGFNVVIVGRGPQLTELQEKVERLELTDKISFLGLRMDVPDLLCEADYFVHPAIWNEGFGISIIEAMSAGLPCIAFSKGAIPEIITDKKNGYIIEKTSSYELAKVLEKCISNGRDDQYLKMSFNARETAERFEIVKMVKSLESVIERC